MDIRQIPIYKFGEFSLYSFSLQKVALLVKEGYWNETEDIHIGNNSFSCLPSSVVEDIIATVIIFTPNKRLQVNDLYPLVTSGRVEDFVLNCLDITCEVLVSTLMSLSVACQNLRSITLSQLACLDTHCSGKISKSFMKSAAVESVLTAARHLESVHSCVEFDLKALRNCPELKVLKVWFLPSSPLLNFLEEVDGHFLCNDSLRVLEVYEDARHPISYTEIAIILKYCRELTRINCSVSRSLECLHSDELYDGTLKRQYKFRKLILGSSFLEPQLACASLISVHIATLTCPLVQELDVLVNDHNTIYALSDFLILESLLIQWEPLSGGDFKIGVQPLLDKIGSNLKTLRILNFSYVDFAAIGKACPALENLKVEYQSESSPEYDPSCSYFKHLQHLSVDSMDEDDGLKESTLLYLLSSCKGLITLDLHCPCPTLNDRIMKEIVKRNNFNNVKDAVMIECSLTAEGIRSFVSSIRRLEIFQFRSSAITIEDAASVVHQVNPHVVIKADFGG